MLWFKKHLNWTMGLALLSALLLLPTVYLETPIVYIVLYISWIVFTLFTGGWVLKEKKRSLATLLWIFLIGIFAFVVIIALKNEAITQNSMICSENQ